MDAKQLFDLVSFSAKSNLK